MSQGDDILQSINTYKNQLAEVELALSSTDEASQQTELQNLRDSIKQLIELTEETLHRSANSPSQHNGPTNDPFDSEFALFMAEMEGVTNISSNKNDNSTNIEDELRNLEGMKCRAPHKHNWGDVMYHNAIVCSVVLDEGGHNSFDKIKVKIMFINPTHQEMLPCPYLMEGNCKFDDEQCKFSHGEIVFFSTLKEYIEPSFELLSVGHIVLAKQIDKLWSRAKIIKIMGENCIVQFEISKKELKLQLHEVLPLDTDSEDVSDDDYCDGEDIINMSLFNTPTSQALGDWEKYTKGIGSKLMQKMGYIIGTGIGRYSNGRIEPISAIVLPPGKSLDHCMNLREKSGGEKDLFSVEKKLRRLAKKQEKKNIKAYEREKNNVNVFNFLNETLAGKSSGPTTSISKSKHRQEIKNETSRSLNVASLKIDEDIKRVERDLCKIKESLSRQSHSNSQLHKSLKLKLSAKQSELQTLKMQAVNIASEQSIRSDKKKMTVF